MRAEQELENKGLEIVGYYILIQITLLNIRNMTEEHALPNMSYLIVSIVEGRENTKQSWRLTEDRSHA